MFKSAYALVGADIFLQLERLAEVMRQAPKGAQRVDFEGEKAELAEVLDELRSFAMFASAKVVVVREADEFVSRYREQLEEYLAKPSTESALVLRMNSLPKNQRIYKLIAGCGEVCDCEAPKDVSKWIAERAKVHKLALGPGAAAALADLIGADLGRLDNEMAKLALQSEGPVDAKMVAQSVSFQREQEMWDMTNEVAAGRVTAAVQRWRQLLATDPSAEFRAVTWLTIWLEKVRKALLMRKEGAGDAEICRSLKIWPFDQQKPFLQTAAALGEAGAARLINRLAELDHRSKSGLGEMAENVERFLLDSTRK